MRRTGPRAAFFVAGRIPTILSRLFDDLAETATAHGDYLHRIFALGLLALHGGIASPIGGSYLARTMNGRPLPAEMRVPVTAGDYRLFRLEQGLLRLSDDGRFTLHFRYYHQLVARGGKPTITPVLSDSETGTFKLGRGIITLVPTKSRGAKSRPSITAIIAGDEIRAAYVLQNGALQERVTLTLRRDASYW
jgi:hypothetical protein